jgi:hypothetical protein
MVNVLKIILIHNFERQGACCGRKKAWILLEA